MPTLAAMKEYVGGLSEPSKMPCYGYSIPAKRCKIGSKLRKVAGSTCKFCYALKGRYVFPNVLAAMERRYESLDKPEWVNYMAVLISHYGKKSGYFRWHDSGDIQSVEHLRKIVQVCLMTPDIQHWIPTREYRIVKDFLAAGHSIPDNLTIRLSGHMIDGPLAPDIPGTVKSAVHRNEPQGHVCVAPKQEGECRSCRACWSRDVELVSYHVH